jgi:hypothetical protein
MTAPRRSSVGPRSQVRRHAGSALPEVHEPLPGPDPGQQPDRTVIHTAAQSRAYE